MFVDLTLGFDKLSIDKDAVDERSNFFVNSGHFGTHIDVHLRTEIPLNYMVSRGVLFDVSHVKNRDI